MACAANSKCDPRAKEENGLPICGSDMAFPYFISFYVLCSFLVSTTII